jgi:ubiquinone/menaquinone biosynthesis C-methylase UbiE
MEDKKSDPVKLEKLNSPIRLSVQDPDLLWEILAPDHPEVLVDIGAGTGVFAKPFSDKMGGGKVYACDILDVMLSWMRQNLPERYRDLIIPMKMDENAVPLPSGIADLVYLVDVYHELKDPLQMLPEALRLLRDGGQLLIVDWKDEEMAMGPPLDHRVALDSIVDAAVQSGFEEVRAHDVLPYHNVVVGRKGSGVGG